jgi:riboflavin synthase
MKLHDIADEVGIAADDKNGNDPKQLKAIAVSRNMRQAKTLIEYVGKGIFPITKPAQAAMWMKR